MTGPVQTGTHVITIDPADITIEERADATEKKVKKKSTRKKKKKKSKKATSSNRVRTTTRRAAASELRLPEMRMGTFPTAPRATGSTGLFGGLFSSMRSANATTANPSVPTAPRMPRFNTARMPRSGVNFGGVARTGLGFARRGNLATRAVGVGAAFGAGALAMSL